MEQVEAKPPLDSELITAAGIEKALSNRHGVSRVGMRGKGGHGLRASGEHTRENQPHPPQISHSVYCGCNHDEGDHVSAEHKDRVTLLHNDDTANAFVKEYMVPEE